jgi:hypothetical protein
VRDYIADMSAAIEDAIPEGDYAAPLVAAELVEKLRATDPGLLSGWLDLRAAVFLADTIARRSNSKRQAARVGGPRRAFAEAAQRFTEQTDPAILAPFATEYVIDAENTRRRVADMTGPDHRFVAAGYAESKRTAALLEKFHVAVARKVGDRRTAEVISESEYLAMLRSITGPAPVQAA